MKKLLIILLLSVCSIGTGQTKLISHPLKLTKSSDYHQILNAVNKQNEVFIFASDKEKFHLLKFNNALFFADSLHLKRPDKSYELMAGYSFGETGNPFLYWASSDFTKIMSIGYDLNKKSPSSVSFELDLKKETVVLTFTENQIFYILTQGNSEDFLKLYIFNDGHFIEKFLDFSAFDFINIRNKPTKFHQIISDYPIEKMDSNNFNPLFYSIRKSKLYIEDNTLLLTMDHNSSVTQLFAINLSTFTVTQNKIIKPKLNNGKGESNSFYHNKNLYQLAVNDEQLKLDIKQLPSGELKKDFTVSKNDSIYFNNSPLYIQHGNERPRVFKSTKKFLRRLSSSEVGLSVYETQGNNLITVGRAKNITRTGDLLLGVTLSAGIAIGGGNIIVNDFFEDSVQSIYFESIIDRNMKHIPGQPQPLAVDYISEFLALHDEIRYESTFRYKNFFVLGYYDINMEEYVLRKFQDGFL